MEKEMNLRQQAMDFHKRKVGDINSTFGGWLKYRAIPTYL